MRINKSQGLSIKKDPKRNKTSIKDILNVDLTNISKDKKADWIKRKTCKSQDLALDKNLELFSHKYNDVESSG